MARSVFLFDGEGRLLLQQRAAGKVSFSMPLNPNRAQSLNKHHLTTPGKVTFPSVWTNTCCSHPLFGQIPDEVDHKEQVLDGSVPGNCSLHIMIDGHAIHKSMRILKDDLAPLSVRQVSEEQQCESWSMN